MDSTELADYILDTAGVAMIPGPPFGERGEGFLRISYATSQAQCKEGMNRIADVAESEQHHPDLHLTGYRNVRIDLMTHAIGGLSENDFIVAAKIDEILS